MSIIKNVLMKCLIITVVIIFLTVTIKQKIKNKPKEAKVFNVPGHDLPQGYLVWNPKCEIPDEDPFSNEIIEINKKLKFTSCADAEEQPLTEITQNFVNDTVIVKFHKRLLLSHLTDDQQFYLCCYSEITRSEKEENAIKEHKLSKCKIFTDSFDLPAPTEFILIKCMLDNSKKLKKIYINAHALIRRKEIETKEEKNETDSIKQINVLMFGIDSVSRLNLLRAMPETAQHLQDTGWFELQGYNKIGVNTFPNVMAILTGLNYDSIVRKCNPYKAGELDKCDFIWKLFKENGYATAYAEDFSGLSTFNHYKKGFLSPPTDHYFRPITLPAEDQFKTKQKQTNSTKVCLGYQNYVDHVYQYGIDFAKIYQNQSYFGMFWTRSFGHAHLNDPSMMDFKIKSYLERLRDEGILNSSIVVFLSDQGQRFGPERNLKTGWLEDRLPFFFISLPEWFQKQHPKIVKYLKINRNRLTSAYDLHMTLKHILEISGIKEISPPRVDCPKCQSLFIEIPWYRSCEEAGIAGHWCTCKRFKDVDVSSGHIENIVQSVVDRINFDLRKLIDTNTCAKLELNEILRAKFNKLDRRASDYVVLFNTHPMNASFEATVRFIQIDKTERFEMLGPISRTNQYEEQSYCTEDAVLKPYCYCIMKRVIVSETIDGDLKNASSSEITDGDLKNSSSSETIIN